MKRTSYILSMLAAASALLLSGCAKELSVVDESPLTFGAEIAGIHQVKSGAEGAADASQAEQKTVFLRAENGSNPISMTCKEYDLYEGDTAVTKAALKTSVNSFTVIGYNNSSVWFPSTSVTAGSSYPAYRWKKGEDRTFFAHANIPSGVIPTFSASGVSLTDYVVPDTAAGELDAMLGRCVGSDGSSTGTAEIKFYHPFAAVEFQVGTLSGVTAISEISIEGVYAKGSTSLNATTAEVDGIMPFTWTTDGTKTVSQTISGGLPESGQPLCVPFVLIPQNLASANVTVKIQATTSEGAKTYLVTVNSGAWLAGKKYVYTLKYSEGPDPEFWVDLGMVSAEGHPVYVSKYNVLSVDSNGEVTFTDDETAVGMIDTKSRDTYTFQNIDCRLMYIAEMKALMNSECFDIAFNDEEQYCSFTPKFGTYSSSIKLPYGLYRGLGNMITRSVDDYLFFTNPYNKYNTYLFWALSSDYSKNDKYLRLVYEDTNIVSARFLNNWSIFYFQGGMANAYMEISDGVEYSDNQINIDGFSVTYLWKNFRFTLKIECSNGFWGYYTTLPSSFTCESTLPREGNTLTFPNPTENTTYTIKFTQKQTADIEQNSKTITINVPGFCLVKGTLLALANGTKKAVEDITYDDEVRVWNFDKGCYDTAKFLFISQPGLKNDHYIKLTFSDGTILNVTGQNSHHHVYNYTDRFFQGVTKMEPGTEVFTENGIVTLISKEWIDEEVEYYNFITEEHINCFANGVLTSSHYGNIYPIDENMKFIKDGRKKVPYSEFKKLGINREWYNELRLGEQPDSLDVLKKYVDKVQSYQLEKPAPTFWQRLKTWWKSIFG